MHANYINVNCEAKAHMCIVKNIHIIVTCTLIKVHEPTTNSGWSLIISSKNAITMNIAVSENNLFSKSLHRQPLKLGNYYFIHSITIIILKILPTDLANKTHVLYTIQQETLGAKFGDKTF